MKFEMPLSPPHRDDEASYKPDSGYSRPLDGGGSGWG
jgi:hypothetical protein